MPAAADTITVTFPRTAVPGFLTLSESLLDRMHDLLERNTDGQLSPIESQELETLAEMAQFGQLIAGMLQAKARP